MARIDILKDTDVTLNAFEVSSLCFAAFNAAKAMTEIAANTENHGLLVAARDILQTIHNTMEQVDLACELRNATPESFEDETS